MGRMLGTGSIGWALGAVGRPLVHWSAQSQLGARRNAMTACTELTARRHERIDAQEFVDTFLGRRSSGTVVHTAVI